MEYIKVSRVIARVRNSLVARCPRQAEIILVASVRGRCPRKCVQAQKRLSRIWTAWAGGVFEFHTLIHSFHNSMCNFSERFVVDCWHVPLGRGGTGRALVCALRARAALILLFWSCTGGHCRRWRGWRASLFFKVCDNYCDISHCDCQLLCGTSVHIFQSGSKTKEKTFIKRIKNKGERESLLGKAFANKLGVTSTACTDGSGWEENPGRQRGVEHRRKEWPAAPCASQAPCASEGCRAHLALENKLSNRALHKESLAGFSLPSPARKEDTTAEPSGQEPDREKDLLPKGQMKEFSYLNSPSHHVPWCYETRLWLCNTKPHESIRPRLFHSHVGTLQLQTTQALGQLGFSLSCFELIQIRCPISLWIK